MTGYMINDYIFSIDANDISVCYDKSFTQEFLINVSLKEYLTNIKAEIDDVQGKWDIVKKVTNKYEYINSCVTIDNMKGSNNSVCSYKPISRSFFKMIEILNNFDFNFEQNISSFHLAEGPGGFIEALSYLRKSNINHFEDIYYGITIIKEMGDQSIPNWKKIQDNSKVTNFIPIYGHD